MEIFIADQHDQFIIGNINGHFGLAFLAHGRRRPKPMAADDDTDLMDYHGLVLYNY